MAPSTSFHMCARGFSCWGLVHVPYLSLSSVFMLRLEREQQLWQWLLLGYQCQGLNFKCSVKCHVLKRVCYEKWRIFTNTAWQWRVSLKILAAFSLPQLSSWLSGIPLPKKSVFSVKHCVQDSQISLGEMTEDEKKLSQGHTEVVTGGGLITGRTWTMGNHRRRRVEEEVGWGGMGIVWALMKARELSGDEFELRSSQRSLFGKSGRWKWRSERGKAQWNIFSDLADEGKIKDEVLVDEVVRQFCFPCGGGSVCCWGPRYNSFLILDSSLSPSLALQMFLWNLSPLC